MKKFAAVFFLLLISLSLLPHRTLAEKAGLETAQELSSESSEGEMKNKQDKKEIKEFTAALYKVYSASASLPGFAERAALCYAPPPLARPTPPPDLYC